MLLFAALSLAAAEPAPAGRLVEATAFRIEAPYAWTWGAQVPPVREGWLLVLEVDPETARPRQVGGRALFVGDWIAEPLNPGWPSGCLVALVGPVELASAPIFFDEVDLPERVDRAAAGARRDAAVAARVPPQAPAPGGAPIEGPDIKAALTAAADRIEACAPEELEWAENLRIIP